MKGETTMKENPFIEEVTLKVKTEKLSAGKHDIFFNRGVTGTGVPQLVGTWRGCKPAWREGLRPVGRGGGVCLQVELGEAGWFGHV